MTKVIAGRSLEVWQQQVPLLKAILECKEVLWCNPLLTECSGRDISDSITEKDIDEAAARLKRFAPYIARVFPDTRAAGGIIESPFVKIPGMQQAIEKFYNQEINGDLYLKCDSHLPISGSIKARGGIYEVLKIAEEIAQKEMGLTYSDNYEILAGPEYTAVFSRYTIVVGSTGNLGLSIGIMSAALGFKVVVHMSADAKEWKKVMLRAKGVTVVEHAADYGKAVAAGRSQAALDSSSVFIDDENSRPLFLGYAVAAKRLALQLKDQGIQVDAGHPLFVYLPCGVGGGPGGITFGLRTVFKDDVHCFFAEPTHSPAMLLGLMTGLHDNISVQEFGLDNVTAADGLAVGRPSGFVGKTLAKDISGVVTVEDSTLYRLLRLLADTENIFLEPSALAGFMGPVRLFADAAGRQYIEKHAAVMPDVTHIVWGTGGSMVPREIMDSFYQQGTI